ncbi:MAG: peptidylprolyl isomerase [Opitutales bacterium]|nr:peptidylprolyl isomerase [Opitutales bacterium]
MKKFSLFISVVFVSYVFLPSLMFAKPINAQDTKVSLKEPVASENKSSLPVKKVEPPKKAQPVEIAKPQPKQSSPAKKKNVPLQSQPAEVVEPKADKASSVKPKVEAKPKPVGKSQPREKAKVSPQESENAAFTKVIDTAQASDTESNKTRNSSSLPAVASVNGQPIGAYAFEALLLEQLRKGTRDSVELRKNIRDELVVQTLLSQLAMEEGLDEEKEVELAFESARRTILSQAWRQNWGKENPIKETEIQREYNATVKKLGDTEYQLRQVVVADETAAYLIIDQMEAGKSLGDLANRYTIESGGKKSKGLLPWVSPSLLLSPIGELITQVKKGEVLSSPVRTQAGWHIVKVEGVRSLTPPSLEQLQSQVRQGILQKKMTKEIQKLLDQAKIKF